MNNDSFTKENLLIFCILRVDINYINFLILKNRLLLVIIIFQSMILFSLNFKILPKQFNNVWCLNVISYYK